MAQSISPTNSAAAEDFQPLFDQSSAAGRAWAAWWRLCAQYCSDLADARDLNDVVAAQAHLLSEGVDALALQSLAHIGPPGQASDGAKDPYPQSPVPLAD